jgi:hypothetical protein
VDAAVLFHHNTTKSNSLNMAEYKPTWNMGSIPDEVLYSEVGRRNAARRTTAGGYRPGAGRKPTLVKCLRCGQQVTKTQARRGHSCQVT